MPTPSHNLTSVATRLLTLHEVMQMTALSRSSIYNLMARGRSPVPVRVTDHAVRWIEQEIRDFIASRPRARYGRTIS